MRWPRGFRWMTSIALGLLLPLLYAPDAHAYAWMIKHGYTGCTACHDDPSGAGVLTDYGRAQGEILLRTRYPGEATGEASSLAGPLWGVVKPPEWLHLGGGFREAWLGLKAEGAPAQQQSITMQADVSADVKIQRFQVEGTIGYAPQGALAASLTRAPDDNLVSRDHWLGYSLGEDSEWLVRAGRIALPFGIRNIEHTLFARSLTRTDINDQQQYGAAVSLSQQQLRGELMLIAGNFQLRPDEFRERGYSGYLEYAPTSTLAAGVSSLFTRADKDIFYLVTDYRYAEGVFVRYAPVEQLVLLAEGDWVYQSLQWQGHRGGYAGYVQADWEPAQGIHIMGTGEMMNGGSAGEPPSASGWFSGVWFFAPHADLRLDDVYQVLGSPGGGTSTAMTVLAQFHVYL
ncbi:MAG: hypothetical protein ABTD50_00270 [Polyangiaceae bacterium]